MLLLENFQKKLVWFVKLGEVCIEMDFLFGVVTTKYPLGDLREVF